MAKLNLVRNSMNRKHKQGKCVNLQEITGENINLQEITGNPGITGNYRITGLGTLH